MKVRNRILLLSSLLLLVSVGGIGNLVWQMPRLDQMQDLKAVLHFLIFLGLFGVGLIFSVLELVRHEIMNPIFQLAAQVARLKEQKIDSHRLELTGSKDIDLLTSAFNDLLDGFEKEENLYRIFTEASPDMIFLLDRDGRVLFGNLNAARQWNYQAEEIIGKRQEELFPPDIAERHKQAVEKIFDSGQSIFIDVHETIGQHKCWIDARMIPVLNKDGRVTAVLGISRDITKRKRAEAEMERTAFYLDTIPDALIVTTPDTKIIKINKAFSDLWGYSPEEVMGKSILNFLPEEELPKHRKEIESAITTGTIRQFESQILTKNGKKVPIELTGEVLKDEGGHVLALIAVISDITERKRAEEALHESEARYRALFAGAPEGIIAADLQTKQFHYVNPAMCRMFGYTGEEFMRLGVADLHPKESLDHVLAEFEAQLRGEKLLSPDLPCLRKDGTVFYANISGISMVIDGYKCNVGFFTDVTAYKRAEQKASILADAIETAHHGCLIISKDYKVVFANNYALTKLGFESDELKNFDLFSLCADRERVKDIIKTMKVTKRWMGEIAIIKKDGKQFPALVSVTALGAEGDASGRGGDIILFQDITIQKEMREKLLTSEKLAVMGRLVADVAHELNNPLAIVIGGTQLMLSRLDKKPSPFQSQLETVLRNARRCKTILGNLLGYGRTIGKKEEAVNLPNLIREAIGDVNYQHDMSAIETVLNYGEITNAEITGNRSALLSVFVNLIRNARQAMGEKGRLTITIEKEDNKHLRIEIHDTGLGMSKEQKAKLFKPFTSGWKDVEGSGLGLATSLGIIETHDGSMSAESEGIGKGATFTILLPCEFKRKK